MSKEETVVKVELSYKRHKAMYLLGWLMMVGSFVGIIFSPTEYVGYLSISTFIGAILYFMSKFLDWWDRGSVQ
jgi:hypothetical protein